MKAKVVPIGSLWAICLPKTAVDRYALADEVDLEMKKDHFVVRASPASGCSTMSTGTSSHPYFEGEE